VHLAANTAEAATIDGQYFTVA